MHPLDNVIWNALTTRQAQLGARDRTASKFHRDVSILGALAEPSRESYAAMAGLLEPAERVGLFVDEGVAMPQLELVSAVPLLQMVREAAVAPDGPSVDAIELTAQDVPDMIALTEVAKPGPFNARTREMGDYFGIRQGGVLVAMAGERLHVPGYTELSAICTHPDHLGRGHAAGLMTYLLRRIAGRGEHAFLHVRPENERAVALYERLGFAKRLHNRYVVLERTTGTRS